jgi:hypothetical protein
MGGPASRDIFLSALAHTAAPTNEPNEKRVATFQARTDRIRQLKAELSPLIEQQRGDIWEMDEWGWSQHKIAAICGLSQVQIHRVLNGQR